VEQYFSSLSKRQTMLLLTSLAFGGSEAVGAFDHLPAEEEELLKYRAQALLLIPRDKRVPLLVQEIKRLMTQRARQQLASADPRRLAEVLSKERPLMIEVVLRGLPVELTEAVRAAIPNHPTIRLQHEVNPEVLSVIRWKLEEALQHNAPRVGTFRFTDLLTLQQREVLTVCDRMGARVLATAVAGLPETEAEAWLSKLPPDQRSLALKAAEQGKSRRLNEDDARTALTQHDALDDPSKGMRSAGAQRLMRAAVAQSPDFAQRMVERYSGDLGLILKRWLKEERKRKISGDGGRLDIVEQLERLAQKGIIDRPMRLPPPFRPPAAPPPALRPPPLAMRAPTGEAVKAPPYPGPRRPSSQGESSVNEPKRKVVSASPAFQAIPRRKTNDSAKSPVIKGRGPTGGSGR
jgi:hypothetical protein